MSLPSRPRVTQNTYTSHRLELKFFFRFHRLKVFCSLSKKQRVACAKNNVSQRQSKRLIYQGQKSFVSQEQKALCLRNKKNCCFWNKTKRHVSPQQKTLCLVNKNLCEEGTKSFVSKVQKLLRHNKQNKICE